MTLKDVEKFDEDYFASKQAMAKELHNRREIINELYKRINKAIDYINNEHRYSNLAGMYEFYGDPEEVIKILKGEDE